MRKYIRKIFLMLLLLSFGSTSLNAQEIGFGCVGFVGIYVGYATQSYEAEGLNRFVSSWNEANQDKLTNTMGSFDDMRGLRIGVNILRKQVGFINFTIKGFYNGYRKTNEASIVEDLRFYENKIELKQNNFGVGLDIGTEIASFLDLKVLDTEIYYHTTKLTTTFNSLDATNISQKYESTESGVGYTIGGGFIINLIGKYLSLEGTAGYSFFEVDQMKVDGSIEPMISMYNSDQPMTNFINKGGFVAVLHMNVGFPL